MHVVTDDRAIAPASMRFDRDYQVMPHLDRYEAAGLAENEEEYDCLLYTSPSPRDRG